MIDGGRDVLSREALRFRYASEQTWDESCGYAALAALLGRYRGLEVDEADLLARSVSGEGTQPIAVSLGQLLRLVRGLGLEARAGRTSWEGLGPLLEKGGPLLVHYDRPSGHFALLFAAGPRGAVTADPARGLELLTRDQFLGRWSGVVLDVTDPRGPGASPEAKAAVHEAEGRAELVDRALSKGPPKR